MITRSNTELHKIETFSIGHFRHGISRIVRLTVYIICGRCDFT